MFLAEEESKGQEKQQREGSKESKRGFFNWMQRLFRGEEEKKSVRRANSIEKSSQIESKLETGHQYEEEDRRKQTFSISDKTWILLINNRKKPQQQKITDASHEGFP